MPNVAAEPLKSLTATIFEQSGAPPDTARCVAEHLVEANLAGHDSHGVLRIMQYLEVIDQGHLRPAGSMQIVRESPVNAVVDGNQGFGQLIARDAMLLAIRKARTCGMGAVAVRNCYHTGRIGTYTKMAAEEGLVGIATVNSGGGGQLVAPFGGIERRLSTNPISIATPSGGPEPFVLDMSSSVAPEGKVRALHHAGKKTPPGWMIDAAGRPTSDTADFYNAPVGALLPLGGPVGHKGACLAFMIDILSGGLSEAGCCETNPPRIGDGMLAIVLDIEQFTTLSDFQTRVATLAEHVTGCPKAEGVEQIFVPGEVEAEQRKRRLRDGIPIDDAVWEQIARICQRLGIDTGAVR